MLEWKMAPMSALESLQRMKYIQVRQIDHLVPKSFLIDAEGVLWYAYFQRQFGKKA